MMAMAIHLFKVGALTLLLVLGVSAFHTAPQNCRRSCLRLSSQQASETSQDAQVFSLAKPMGLVLEEVEEGKASGVSIVDINPDGSAGRIGEIQKGMRLLAVNGQDCTSCTFDEVMDKLIAADGEVQVTLQSSSPKQTLVVPGAIQPLEAPTEKVEPPPEGPFEVIVLSGEEKRVLTIQAGANLRKELLANGVEVYAGMAKLTNCNGGGQCGTCAVEVVAGEGLGPARSEWEERKLRGRPGSHRLACMNTVAGPVSVRVKPSNKK
mmetsp:Transcript_3125/g.5057  ORF Transcript_3125/g.5057 Transcript_3125/m.5057 type:complete len:265 (+) Transcript_3125:37-831(+)